MDISWHNIRDWGIEGKAWSGTIRYFDRLPAKAEKTMPSTVWDLSHSPTGMSVLFETDASSIHARWKLKLEQLNEPDFSSCAVSGLDLYAKSAGEWKWAGTARKITARSQNQCIVEGMEPGRRRFILYLPLRNPLEELEIGIPGHSFFKPVMPRRAKPLVFYGSSIIHGAYASRPGMVYSSILGRWLDNPVINLGFSGNARMEESMANLISEINAKAYILDPLPNMDPGLVRERAENFLRILCGKRPGTPLVFVEDGCPYSNSWLLPARKSELAEKWKEMRLIFRNLKGKGFKNMYYVKHDGLFGGDDHECALDAVHPSDLGFMRIAEEIYPLLRRLCRQEKD